MPRRSAITLDDVAEWKNLADAFGRAARGHRDRADVRHFAGHLDHELQRLQNEILDGRAPEGRWTSFSIFDPKPRRILAPCFRDRVLHHALMAQMGPVLERSLVDDTFACRVGRGTLAAAMRAQHHLRRFACFVQIDIRAYFASIDHGVLMQLLARRFRCRRLLSLCAAVLARTPDGPGRGLPIGALTSQHFANAYLDALDRFLLESLRVRGIVRYMDDVVWWCDDLARCHETLAAVRAFTLRARCLEVKPDARIGWSAQGVRFVGFRILRGGMRLTLRRRKRYTAARRQAEARYQEGLVDAQGLQRAYDAALAITAHADAARWRRAELLRRGSLDA